MRDRVLKGKVAENVYRGNCPRPRVTMFPEDTTMYARVSQKRQLSLYSAP